MLLCPVIMAQRGKIMNIDFDKLIDRRGTSSLKWNVADGELPMWVADMDFAAAPPIYEAMKKRLEHGVFGYAVVNDEWYSAVQSWWSRRHGFAPKKEWMLFSEGVVPAISSFVRAFTAPGESVLLQTPVYNCFISCVVDNGRKVADCPLAYENGVYSVDFAALEECLAREDVKLMIVCNPHNPTGNIWDRQTLAKIGTLAKKYGVTVISDEIHCDIVEPGYHYTPYAAASEECLMNCIMCCAPSKAFNIAGIQTSVAIVADEALRAKVRAALNVFAIPAAIAAFNDGEEWIEAFNKYVFEGRAYCDSRLENELPELKLVKANATYLLWLDCSAVTSDATDLQKFLRKETGLYLQEGEAYGKEGKAFLRVNIACPKSTLEDGMNRLVAGTKKYIARHKA